MFNLSQKQDTTATNNSIKPSGNFMKSPTTEPQVPEPAAKPTVSKFDVDKAVSALDSNALAESNGQCAKYVRMALEAGGFDTSGHPVSAKDYKNFLIGKGFEVVATDAYQKGDIVVIEGFTGKKSHPHGHIAMYDGTQWVSDFKQRTLMPGSDYRTYQPAYVILR